MTFNILYSRKSLKKWPYIKNFKNKLKLGI